VYWSAVAPPLIMKESKRLARMGHIESKFCSWLSLLQLPLVSNCRSVAEFFRGWNLLITSEIKAVLPVNADVMTQQRREKPEVFFFRLNAIGAEFLDASLQMNRIPTHDGGQQQI
jgi:hypothetical protein